MESTKVYSVSKRITYVFIALSMLMSQNLDAAQSDQGFLRPEAIVKIDDAVHSENLPATCPTGETHQPTTAIPSESPTSNNIYIDGSLPDAHILREAVANAEKGTFYLFSHGRPGELLINGQWLSKEGIANFINDKLKAKSQQPTAIHIYGCNFAQGEKGRQAVSYLEKYFCLSIAASDDITGVGGDWVLEIGDQFFSVVDYAHNLQLIDPLTNGTFDSPTVMGSRVPAIPTGWTRLSGATFLNEVFSGGQTLDLGAVGTTTRLRQTFTVMAPGIYQLALTELRNSSNFGGATADLDVFIDGNLELEYNSSTGGFNVTRTTEVSLAAGTHTIEFTVTNVSFGPSGFGTPGVRMDDVTLVRISDLPADPAGAVSGTVFRDYNGNGLQETDEPLVPGVTVNAYDAGNALCGTAVTTGGFSGPNYALSGCSTGPVRVEFVLPDGEPLADAATDYSSTSGNVYGTSVQFANGNSSNVNFAISDPDDYNVGSPEVELFLPCYVNGDPLPPGSATGALDWFVSFDYPAAPPAPMPTRKVEGSVLGATWGVAYSKQADRVFTSALLKRHIGLGTMGTGGIYMLEPTATSFNVTEFYDMDANGHRTRATAGSLAYGDGSSFTIATNGSGTGTGVSFNGPVDPVSGQPEGLGVVGTNSQRGLTPNPNDPSYDPAAFDQVGKVGLGGLEISDDGRFLFVMNLYSRSVFRLELDDPNNPAAVVNVTEISLPAVSCNNGEFRPWALTYLRGKLYAGGLCSAENGGTLADMEAFVFELENPETGPAFSAAPLFTFPLDYDPQLVSNNTWQIWENEINIPVFTSNYLRDPTPILSDLTFGNNGQMIINLMSRWGLQQQTENYLYLAGATFRENIGGGGDLVVAGLDAGTGIFQLEDNGVFTSNGITFLGANLNTPRQFFADGSGFIGPLGTSVYLPGLSYITATGIENSDQVGYNYSLSNGGELSSFIIADGATSGVEQKGLGLGEMELSGPEPNLEIGNRVWVDTDNDGVQDPNEAVIPGVEVQLWKEDSPGSGTFSQIAMVTTDANGEYYFTSATGTSTTGITYGVTDLLPGMNYELRFPTTTTVGMDVLSLTAVNMGGSDPNADVRDSDADISTGVVSFM
ncbi:MAG TPA: SdrD B-like domain-containing protein, partial [Halalkalibaculum sp.]|nr:SdrD B-like domain-containing protein [Halalkalibaculum sp.]